MFTSTQTQFRAQNAQLAKNAKVVFFILAAGSVLLAFFLNWLTADTNMLLLFYTAPLLLLIFAGPVFGEAGRRFDPLEGVNFFLLTFFLMIYIGFVDCIVSGSEYVEDGIIPIAILYAVIALVAFYFGYYSALGGIIGNSIPVYAGWSQRRVRRLVFLYSILGLACYAVLVIPAGGLAYVLTHTSQKSQMLSSKGYFVLGTNFLGLGFLVYYTYRLSIHGKTGLTFWFFLMGVLFLSLLFGSRAGVVFFAASMAIIFNYEVRRIKLSTLLAGGVTVLILLALLGIYRFDLGHALLGKTTLKGESLSFIFRIFVSEHLNVAERFLLILKEVPDSLDFEKGRSYIALLCYAVPRVIWPGKPEALGAVFTKAFHPAAYKSGVIFGVSMLGELYANFHFIGIIVGMFIYGLLYKMFYAHLRCNIKNPGAILLYAMVVTPLTLGLKGGYWDIVPGLFFNVVATLLAVRYVSGGRKEAL